MKKLFVILVGVIGFVSCTVMTRTEMAKVRDVAGVVLHVPTIADLDVPANRVTETFNVKLPANMKGLPVITEDVKTFATAELLKKHDADVLIEPRYSVEAALSLSKFRFNVVVSGYPAKYKNFRPMVEKDTIWLQPLPPHLFPAKKTSTLVMPK